ncbi:MAG: helix-turn-helix domain-containing protein [Thermoplasmata archaeon]|nr:helix-turn-helix domain-containing protein [Thermoplasmata archaeon]
MYKERVNNTELKILKTISTDVKSVMALAKALEKSKSYISECITHLEQMGFVDVQHQGNVTILHIARTPLGNEISKLLREEAIMNSYKCIGGSRLKIMPLVLEPGYSAKEISERARLSPRTVQAILGGWRQMGLVVLRGRTYTLNTRHEVIISFADKYAEHRNLSHLKERHPDGTLVWHQRDEYIFSIEREISDGVYKPAAYSRLAELNFDIISRNEYYHYSPISSEISKAEALIQALKMDMLNPRVKQFIQQSIGNGSVTHKELEEYSKKYSIQMEVEGNLHG